MKEKLNILVVDDSRSVREVMLSRIKTLGYNAYEADSVKNVYEVFKKEKIDLMFLDIRLPEISGLRFLEQLKREKRDIIVIILTAHESPETAVEAIEKGAFDYVVKPVNPGHIELIIRRAIKRYQMESEYKNAIEKRFKSTKEFIKDANEMQEIIDNLKSEVNALLVQQHREPKYKV